MDDRARMAVDHLVDGLVGAPGQPGIMSNAFLDMMTGYIQGTRARAPLDVWQWCVNAAEKRELTLSQFLLYIIVIDGASIRRNDVTEEIVVEMFEAMTNG